MDKEIIVKDVTKKYGDILALDKLSFSLSPGRVMGLLGPNGSGKTTLLKAIMGLVRLDEGEILIGDKKISHKLKQNIAYLPDKDFIYDGFMVADALSLYDDFYTDFNPAAADKLIAYFHLGGKEKIDGLSKGDSKKLALSLTLARSAEIFLLDEPLEGLDPISALKIIDIIIDKVAEGASFIISTHQIELLENIFDDVIFLNRGHIHQQGAAIAIREEADMSLLDYYDEIYIG